jgi:hypothetical protein
LIVLFRALRVHLQPSFGNGGDFAAVRVAAPVLLRFNSPVSVITVLIRILHGSREV